MTCNYCGWCEEAGVAHDCQQELRRNIASLTAQRDELLASIKAAHKVLDEETHGGSGRYDRDVALGILSAAIAKAESEGER